MTTVEPALARVRASLFSVVFGLAGFVVVLQQVEILWHLPVLYSRYLLPATVVAFAGLLILYALKVARHPALARAEMCDPAQIGYLAGGIAVGLILLGLAVADLRPLLAEVCAYTGALCAFLFSLPAPVVAWRTDRAALSLLLPVTGVLLATVVVVRYVPPAFGWGFFGLGLLGWLLLLATLARKLTAIRARMTPAATLLVAPPAAAFLAYISLEPIADPYSQTLYFMTWLIAIGIVLQVRRIRFSRAWWPSVLPMALLTSATLWMYELTLTHLYKSLALLLLFVLAALVIALLVVSAGDTLRGRLGSNET